MQHFSSINKNFGARGCMVMCLTGFPALLYGIEPNALKKILVKNKYLFTDISSDKTKDLLDINKEKLVSSIIPMHEDFNSIILKQSVMIRLGGEGKSNHFIIRYQNVDSGRFEIYDPAFDDVFYDHNALYEYYWDTSGRSPVGYRNFPFFADSEILL